MSELSVREERAQEGVLQFAEEMQAIRGDSEHPPLYPNAGKKDAWKTYCKERWGVSESMVRKILQAAPVLRRINDPAQGRRLTDVHSAAAVATLPEPVQDAILEDAPRRDIVKARAKAARQIAKKAERHDVAVDFDEMIEAARKARPPKPKPKPEPLPDDLKDENLPPKLTPEDHGWLPRKLAGEALLSLWRVHQKLQDSAPPSSDDREATVSKVLKLMDLAPIVLADLRGESTIPDDEIAAMMEEASR